MSKAGASATTTKAASEPRLTDAALALAKPASSSACFHSPAVSSEPAGKLRSPCFSSLRSDSSSQGPWKATLASSGLAILTSWLFLLSRKLSDV